MKIDNKKVDMFYDLVDEACMTYYHDIKRDYLEGFISFTEALYEGVNESVLSAEATEKIEKLINDINKQDFLNEEIRLAAELILIKGYKHKNMNLDFLTPDAICYIFSYLVNTMVKSDYKELLSNDKELTIMDTVIGAGNMLQTVINNAEVNIKGIGIEKDELFARLATAVSMLIDNEVVVNCNDAKEPNPNIADIIIGDFGEISEIYDIIISRLDNIKENGYFAYLINNDFFAKADSKFRERLLKEATLMGLIVLPQTFVSGNHVGKSILVGKKEVLTDFQMSVINIDDLSEDSMIKVIYKINKMFNINGGN